MGTSLRAPAAAPGGARKLKYDIAAISSEYLLARRATGIGKSKSGCADDDAPSEAPGIPRETPRPKLGDSGPRIRQFTGAPALREWGS